ncbi:MAG: EscU/YscU/HrcU family type III secretion system export apparatus switch protein [Hyphomicrobiales bacterium]|nr:EscU/YscU/HrcU family type III secretion system export apparatus switch protein [Hyphomicrobiales bacterium]
MAESDSQDGKTEPATQKRIADALEKGDAPHSREAGTAAGLAALYAILAFGVAGAAHDMVRAMSVMLADPAGFRLHASADAARLFTAVAFAAGAAAGPLIAALALAGLAAGLAQGGSRLVWSRLAPDFARVSPDKGLKRLLGAQGAAEFAKAVLKLALLAAATAAFLHMSLADIVAAGLMEPALTPDLMRRLAARALLFALIFAVCLAALDVLWSRLLWLRRLRMSHQDIKDELKQMEGDPLVKMRLRSLAKERSRRRMMAAVPRATLVLANPTHYAVALRYKHGETRAPVVLAKGKNLIALKIRALAEEHGVPVVEDRPLARALHDAAAVDAQIPPEFFQAVAQIIVYLRNRGAMLAGGATPLSNGHDHGKRRPS